MATKGSVLKSQATEAGLRLTPKGDLIASTVEATREAFLKAMEAATGPVVLDLSNTRQIDSLGITLVLGLFKSCQQKGLPFAIEGVKRDILRVFRLFNLTKFFTVREAERE
jgi:anti-anti-sigma factor